MGGLVLVALGDALNTATASRFPVFLIVAMTLAAFGPYLISGIRTEQAMVYGAIACLFPMVLMHARPYFPIIALWVSIVLIALLGFIPPTAHTGNHPPGGAVATLDNYLVPVAVMLLVWSAVPPGLARDILRKFAAVTVLLTALNGFISVIGTRVDLSAYLRRFWSEAGIGTTAENAAALGRLSGVFNQPAEAGVMYGIAGLLAVWRFREKPKIMFLLLALICVGGLLCVSKVFVLGGLPLILFYLWKSNTGTGKLGVLFSVVLVGLGISATGLLQQWTGYNYLARLLTPAQDQGLIEFYSAGRWNEGSNMFDVIGSVLSVRPLTGFGAGALNVAYDSAWTEVIVVSGMIGVILLALVFIALFRMARTLEPDLRRLAMFTVVFLLGASFGIPSLTANRVATIVWIMVALLSLLTRRSPNDSSAESHGRQEATSVNKSAMAAAPGLQNVRKHPEVVTYPPVRRI
jgi:hypothetical protein